VICEKLRRYGCSEDAVAWIHSYLTNRVQAVRINGIESDDAAVLTGVPQGSILGPLLFLVVVNDLPQVIQHALTSMFADDTELADAYDPKDERSIADLELRLNADLESVRAWLTKNSLLMNCLKTELLLIGHPEVVRSGRKPVVRLNDDVVEYSTGETESGCCVRQRTLVQSSRRRCRASRRAEARQPRPSPSAYAVYRSATRC
jgi:hypothetical protein